MAAVTLAGCRMQVSMTVHENNTVDGSMLLAMTSEEASSLSEMGMDMDSLFDEMTSSADTDFGGAKTEIRDYNENGETGKELVYTGADISKMDQDGTGVKITREGDEFVLKGDADMSSEEMAGAGMLASSFDITYSVTFPGKVKESNGEVNGNTVTWKPRLGEKNEMTATAAAKPGGTGGALTWILIVAGVAVIAIAVVILLVTRNNKKKAALRAAQAAEAGAQMAPGGSFDPAAPAFPVAQPPVGEVPAPGYEAYGPPSAPAPVEAASPVAPVEAASPVAPVEATPPVAPVEATPPVAPVEAAAPTAPAEATPPVAPAPAEPEAQVTPPPMAPPV
jgi:hypothetical protein